MHAVHVHWARKLTKPYAEGGLPADRNDSSAIPLSRPAVAPGQLAGWVGSRLGFAGNSSTPGRLRWTLDVQPNQKNVVALSFHA